MFYQAFHTISRLNDPFNLLQVKLKMKHEYSIAVLRDAINDFPAALMVSRTGIIHVLLDILSSAYTFADYGM